MSKPLPAETVTLLAPGSPKRIFLAVNTRARRGADAVGAAVAILQARGHEVRTVPIDGRRELERALKDSVGKIDVAIIGGGDGTLISAIDGLRACGAPLAILPLGTINELSRTLGIPFDLEGACALVDTGVVQTIDVGSVNGSYYLNEASIGLSTHIARQQTAPLKKKFGMLTVPITTLRAFPHVHPYQLDVMLEDGTTRRFRTVQMTIANSYRFGGVVENDNASIEDGLLELYSIDVRDWRGGLKVAVAVALHRFTQIDEVQTLRGKSFRVSGRKAHHVFADGESATRLPAEFKSLPDALAVLVPKDRLPKIR